MTISLTHVYCAGPGARYVILSMPRLITVPIVLLGMHRCGTIIPKRFRVCPVSTLVFSVLMTVYVYSAKPAFS